MKGQHRGGGHPYGSDEPTPRPSGQERYGPRHGSSWPDDERSESEQPYGPGQERPASPDEGAADPYAQRPAGTGNESPYPPADPNARPARPDPLGPDFNTGTPGTGPQNADPYAGGPSSPDPYAGGPSSPAPYAGGPSSPDPYAGGPSSPDPYTGGPQGADPYEPGSPGGAGGQFTAGALGGGRFGADAHGPDQSPETPGDLRGPAPQGSDPRGPEPQGGAPRHPSEETTAQYQRRPEWEAKPYAPPNASTEAMPEVPSRDQRVASASAADPSPGPPPPAAPPPPEPQSGADQDTAAPTSAFRAFVGGDGDEGGYPGYSRIGEDDETEQGGSNVGVWSLVLGIVGIVAMPLLGLGLIASVAALFTARTAARHGGSGMSTAGRFLGWIGVGLFVVGLVGGVTYALM